MIRVVPGIMESVMGEPEQGSAGRSKKVFFWSALAMGFVGAALLDLIKWGIGLSAGS